MRLLVIAAVALLTFIPSLGAAQTNEIHELVISSNWAGLGNGQHSGLTITRKADGYYNDNVVVDRKLISDLIAAINEPVIKKSSLANLGITKAWLKANAATGIREYAAEYFSKAAPNLQRLFFLSFNNPTLIATLLRSSRRARWTDDYPVFKVQLTYGSGRKIRISSEAQPLFMLPWTIVRNGKTAKTYNAHISRAISNLLPDEFANKERIAGEGLAEELAREVMREIEPEWNRLDAENNAGKFLDQLRRSCQVFDAEINGYHGVDHGKEWSEGNPIEINLHVTLRKMSFGKGFVVSAVFPYRNERVENIDLFLKNIDRFENLVHSVPWLMTYLGTHPQTRIELRFVTDRSFGDKPLKSFAEDMNNSTLVTEIARLKESVSLIVVNHAVFWLVLPDLRMVLWRFNGESGLLKWKSTDFTHKDCIAYPDYPASQCVGAVISKDGVIMK